MEVLQKPRTHFQFPHSLKNEPCIWGVRIEERVAPLETARRWYGDMLTTCPNCLHVFDQPLSSCCAFSRSPTSHSTPAQATVAATATLAPPPPQPQAPVGGGGGSDEPSAATAAAAAAAAAMAAASLLQPPPTTHQLQLTATPSPGPSPPPPVLLSATLQLPPGTMPTTCTVAVTTAAPPLRALAGMAGGGIVLQQQLPLQDPSKSSSMSMETSFAGTSASLLPQPSPSAPLSFVLPGPMPGTPRALPVGSMPFQWNTTGGTAVHHQWGSAASASFHLNVQMPAMAAATVQMPAMLTTAMAPPMAPSSPVPQSDMDLERLAATLNSLRASGWYYEGLSWQESADALQATSPGTFLVRDSSDPRFLFSLSVQTERGPTSIRLHYVCGNFRLDAEPRLAPLMPLFDCVVKLVEYYVELTRNRGQNKVPTRDKEQVWVDARGQMYSHILLRSPLYKKRQLPNLQHLARLAINKQARSAGRPPLAVAAHLPLPASLQSFMREYPYVH